VYGFGDNSDGQAGNGLVGNDITAAAAVYGLDSFVAVSDYGPTRYALRSDGSVWAWGNGWNGSLGDGTAHTSYVDTPVKVKELTGLRAIGVGIRSGYAVTSDGKEYAWGGGQDGLRGDGNERAKSSVPVPVPGVSGATGLGGNGYAIA
jgi:alpha-tubulin suppressor-like RCC1 family protein